MKLFKSSLASMFLILLAVNFSACVDDEMAIAPTPDPEPEPEVIVSEETVILTDQDTLIISVVDSDRLTIAPSLLADTIEVGDYIVAGVSPTFPNGVLARILRVERDNNGAVAMNTEPAALTDVIEKASVRYRKTFTLDDTLKSNFNTSLSVVLYDHDDNLETTDDQVRVSGANMASIDFIWDVDIDLATLKYAKIGISLENETEAKLDVVIGTNLNLADIPYIGVEKDAVNWEFAHQTILVGGVPVVVQPIFKLKAGFDGEIKGSFSINAGYESDQEAYLEYTQAAGWTGEVTRQPNYSLTSADVQVELDMKYYIKASLEAKTYGVLTTGISLSPQLKFKTECDLTEFDCPWSMKGKLAASLFANVEVFSSTLIDQSFDFTLAEKTFAEGNFNQIYTGDLIIQEESEANAFAIGGYRKIEGNLYIVGSELSSIAALSNLIEVTGDLLIVNSVPDLTGLESLRKVGGELKLYQLDISDVLSLASLEEVGGQFIIQECDILNNLTGLEALTRAGELIVFFNQSITSLSGLNNLSQAGLVSIGSNPSLSSIEGLIGLQEVESGFALANNPNVSSISSLENLTTVGGDLRIQGNGLVNLNGLENITSLQLLQVSRENSLISLQGIDNLNSIDLDLDLSENPNLNSLEALSSLTSIGKALYLNNTGISSLDNFENLAFVGEHLQINGNENLTDFCGLSNLITNGFSGNYFANSNGYNPTLVDLQEGNCTP